MSTPAEFWTIEKIEDAVTLNSGESVTLEFKAQLPDFSDKGKAELLKDVSAMANVAGGSILYGIEESDGKASSFCGLKIESSDELIRRIAQIIQDGVEPRLHVQIYVVPTTNGDVLALEVPRSLDGPHRFKFNNNYRFVVRNDRHISDLTYGQLRASFAHTQQTLSRIEKLWRDEFYATDFWRPVVSEASVLVRLSSILSSEGNQIIDPKAAYNHWSTLIMRNWGGGSPSFNYNGLAVHPGGDKALKAFAQVHRVGAVTTWRGLKSLHSEENIFYGGWVVGFVRQSFRIQRKLFEQLGITGSFVFNVGLRNVRDYRMVSVDGYGFEEEHRTSTNDIEAYPVWIEDIQAVDENSAELFAQPMDLTWQAFGESGCPRKMLEEKLD